MVKSQHCGTGIGVAEYIEVEAGVRYWEDATVDGEDDVDGSRIPLRKGNFWCPVIHLKTGRVMDWPKGVSALIHYKVCDEGQYWLLDADRKRIAKYADFYVPGSILCIGENGYGDYIIMDISLDGVICNWKVPAIYAEHWKTGSGDVG